jgi:serine protease Do
MPARLRTSLLPVLLCAAAMAPLAACTATDPSAPPAASASPVPLPQPQPTTNADIVESVAPSVVTVRTGAGLGSGVVYRPDVVLTNQHVVGDAHDVTIDFADGTSAPGTVLATDTITDLAVVRSSRGGLPAADFRQDLPRPGDPVLAIGSPLGFENTVTAGIVSGVDREIPGSAAQGRALVDLIQVDAPISPGNSGGALLDGSGRIIGINEAYLPPSTGAVSLAFAIPAATAVDIAGQLLATGQATHPFLGVSIGRLTASIRERLGVTADSGALVLAVEPGGPADAAGLRSGDVVVRFADADVASVEDLLGALRGTQPGQQVPVEVARGADRVPATITIGSKTG